MIAQTFANLSNNTAIGPRSYTRREESYGVVPAETVQEQYNHLLFALCEGWCVDPPVYVRQAWSTKLASTLTYHFVLRRAGELTLTSVHDNPVVRDLITRHGWNISWLGGEVETASEQNPA